MKYLTIIILAIALFIIGYMTYGDFIMWSLPKVKGLKFTVNTFAGQFTGMIGFSLTLALIPVSVALLWKYSPIIKVQRRAFTVLIIVTSICLFAYIRHQWITIEANYHLQYASPTIDGIPLQTSIPLDKFNITTYMFLGLIAGSAISYFVLRESKFSK